MHDRQHEDFMRRAIELAANAPRAPFGAVIVNAETGVVLAEGWNRSSANPTWHGEIDAINNLDHGAIPIKSLELTLYTTAEPCPMCQAAIHWTGISQVVYGTSIPSLQQFGWSQIAIRAIEVAAQADFQTCEIIGGVLEDECDSLFRDAVRHFE